MSSHRRLGALVPSLAQLASRSRRAFTLVEILVAVAISMVVILTAVSAFRMVVKAISSANAMSVENSLLRTGLQIAWLDVDYWHSHADDRPPYNKGWARVRQQADDPATGSGIYENTWRRPFQPVRYLARTDTAERDPNPATAGTANDQSLFNAANPTLAQAGNYFDNSGDFFNDPYNRNDYVPNPNAMLPHDPRAISRIALRSMRVPMREDNGCTYTGMYVLGYPRLAIGDYALVGATEMRDPAGAVNPRYPNNAATPGVRTTVNLKGVPDVAASPTTTISIDCPIDPGWQTHQPMLWFNLYQRLSYLGFYQYASAGTPISFGDREGRVPDMNAVPLPPYTYRLSPNWFQYQWERDFSQYIGVCDIITRVGGKYDPCQSNGGWETRAPEALCYRVTWPALNGVYGQTFEEEMHGNPFMVFIGSGNKSAWWGNSGENVASWGNWGMNQQFERGDMSRIDEAAISRTVWLPYNLTDIEKAEPDTGTSINPTTSKIRTTPGAVDYTSKPPQAPVMSTSIMRYGRVGGCQDLTVTRVSIEDPATGRKTEIMCTPFGTTYRGARQHWRLYSKGIAPTTPAPVGYRFGYPDKACAGDFYDVNDGPYYVP